MHFIRMVHACSNTTNTIIIAITRIYGMLYYTPGIDTMYSDNGKNATTSTTSSIIMDVCAVAYFGHKVPQFYHMSLCGVLTYTHTHHTTTSTSTIIIIIIPLFLLWEITTGYYMRVPAHTSKLTLNFKYIQNFWISNTDIIHIYMQIHCTVYTVCTFCFDFYSSMWILITRRIPKL